MITTADIIVFLSFARANLYLLYLNHHLQEDQVHTFHRKFGRTAFFFKKMNPKRYRPFLGTMLSSKKIVSTSNSSFLFFSSSTFRFGAVVENLSIFTMWWRGWSTSKLIREGSTKINLSKFLQLYSSRIPHHKFERHDNYSLLPHQPVDFFKLSNNTISCFFQRKCVFILIFVFSI